MTQEKPVLKATPQEIITQRISDAAKVLEVKEDVIQRGLNILGIKMDDFSLKLLESNSCSETDINGAVSEAYIYSFPEKEHANLRIPLPRLVAAVKILKGKDPLGKPDFDLKPDLLSTLVPIGQKSNQSLLEQYNQTCPTEVEDELKKRSKGQPFIVFLENGVIDIPTSLRLLALARRQDMPSTFDVGGKIKKLYRIGEFPLDYFIECPFHPNILLVDGYCEESGVTWDVAQMEKMQFCRLLTTVYSKYQLDENRLAKMTMDALKNEFPKAVLEWEDAKEIGKLPNLKTKVSKGSGRDPFHVVH